MILLSDFLIRKIEKLRFYAKINLRIRFMFLSVFSIWTIYTMYNGVFYLYSEVIVCLLLSTLMVNIVSDMIKSEMENILDALDYEKSKIKYNSLDTKF